MKPVLTFLLFILIKSSVAQVYHHFPDSSARWSEYSLSIYTIPSQYTSRDYYGKVYTIGKDTIINSLKYSLIGYQDSWEAHFENSKLFSVKGNALVPVGEIFGAIREDSSKKVWYYNFHSNPLTEIILYDFNLHIGDSIPPWGNFNVGRKVTSIDSVQLSDGTFRKRFCFLGCDLNHAHDYWIEGIGSSQGLFGSYLAVSVPGGWVPGNRLNCFWQNGACLYNLNLLPTIVSCDNLVGVTTPDFDEYNFSPNPSSNQLNLNFANGFKKIEIKNLLGESVFTGTTYDKHYSIDISSLKTGLYFLLVTNSANETAVKKFVKL